MTEESDFVCMSNVYDNTKQPCKVESCFPSKLLCAMCGKPSNEHDSVDYIILKSGTWHCDKQIDFCHIVWGNCCYSMLEWYMNKRPYL